MTRPAARAKCRILFPFPSSFFPFHGADFSFPSFRLPDKSPHTPSSKERASGTTCSEKGVFLFLNLSFIKDGSGASGLLQTVEPCQRGMSTWGGLVFCVFECLLGCS